MPGDAIALERPSGELSYIKGSLLPATKLKIQQIFQKYAVGSNNSFAFHVGSRLAMTEMDVTPQKAAPERFEARVVYEVVNDKCEILI
jgi:acyl-coenzyme A thioesterase 13